MGKMKDYQIELANLESEFIWFCKELFQSKGFKVVSDEADDRFSERLINRPDLIVSDTSGKYIAVETKIYRSKHFSSSLISNALAHLKKVASTLKIEQSILIIPVPLNNRYEGYNKNDENLSIWDINKLTELVEDDPGLAALLIDFIRDLEVDQSFPDTNRWVDKIISKYELHAWDNKPQIIKNNGEAIALQLSKCPQGREGAESYEKICRLALEYLFNDDFKNWKTQENIEAGFHRIDLIARLSSQHDFWRTIAQDFHCRYIVFEFKNYTVPLPQNQIFTTEKYLFPKALRSVAFLVARNGFHEAATHAVKGALRDAGKLIICIDNDDLIKMLRYKDEGDDPTNILIAKLDSFLIDISR